MCLLTSKTLLRERCYIILALAFASDPAVLQEALSESWAVSAVNNKPRELHPIAQIAIDAGQRRIGDTAISLSPRAPNHMINHAWLLRYPISLNNVRNCKVGKSWRECYSCCHRRGLPHSWKNSQELGSVKRIPAYSCRRSSCWSTCMAMKQCRRDKQGMKRDLHMLCLWMDQPSVWRM